MRTMLMDKAFEDEKAITIPKRYFMAKFTSEERAAITAAAKTTDELMLWKENLLLADDIRLDHPDLIKGMNKIVAAGLLTEARKVEILTS